MLLNASLGLFVRPVPSVPIYWEANSKKLNEPPNILAGMACPQGNSHLGKHAKNLPFHTHDSATLEIDTNSVTVRDTKSHRHGGFFSA